MLEGVETYGGRVGGVLEGWRGVRKVEGCEKGGEVWWEWWGSV